MELQLLNFTCKSLLLQKFFVNVIEFYDGTIMSSLAYIMV